MNATGRLPGENSTAGGSTTGSDRTETNPGDAGEEDKTVIVGGGARVHSSAMPGMSADDATPMHTVLPPGTRLGEFEIVQLIGEGGFGIG